MNSARKINIQPNAQGNILFLILIALGTLASLTFGVVQSQKGGNFSNQNADTSIQVNEILAYGVQIEQAVRQLLTQNGCEIVQLSFDHPDSSVFNQTNFYLNPNAPTDLSCHVFNQGASGFSAGGVNWLFPPQIAIDAGAVEYIFRANRGVANIGTDTGNEGLDLLMTVAVSREACLLVNKKTGIDNPAGEPPSGAMSAGNTLGSTTTFPILNATNSEGFVAGGFIGLDAGSPTQVAGFPIGCTFDTDGNRYVMYYTLLAR